MAIKTQVESPTPIWKASDSWAARNPSTGARDWEILKICWPASLEKRWASGQWSSNWPPMYTYTDICATHSGHTQTQINFKKYLKLQKTLLWKRNPQECHTWPGGFRKNSAKDAPRYFTLNVNFLDNHHQGQWHGFPFLVSTQLLTTGLPIILPKNFSSLLPKRPTWCSSLSSLAARSQVTLRLCEELSSALCSTVLAVGHTWRLP